MEETLSTNVGYISEFISVLSSVVTGQRPFRYNVQYTLVSFTDEQTTEQAAPYGTQRQGVSTYTEKEKNEMREDLSQYFEIDEEQ